MQVYAPFFLQMTFCSNLLDLSKTLGHSSFTQLGVARLCWFDCCDLPCRTSCCCCPASSQGEAQEGCFAGSSDGGDLGGDDGDLGDGVCESEDENN